MTVEVRVVGSPAECGRLVEALEASPRVSTVRTFGPYPCRDDRLRVRLYLRVSLARR